ncbi:hypothetical protein QFC21_005986 [Naganishia friedmannii]|uniref:Uncharacterized protein n=1 Tax=Naganishia friedmannii TaxID=89922 RepID=A0ACC2V5B3_9TREE|nr:hypothetical protein QFC21_005986 [Naganishia friedmannii]
MTSQVQAHGFCTKIEIGGVTYPGFDPRSPFAMLTKGPQRPADNAHTEKADYTTAQVATGGNSLSATNYKQDTVPAKGGDKVIVHYDQWPQPHSGPTMVYMANCGKSCDGVEGGDLDWFKIGQEGFHDGQWPNDRLLKSNNWGSQFTLPTNLPSGNLGDPQFYPVAFQIDLKSSGTVDPQPKGKFPDMYLNDPQDFKSWNIYEAGAGNADMKLPGITVYRGSDAKVGTAGTNGAQDGIGGGELSPPGKPTKAPAPSSSTTLLVNSVDAAGNQEGRMFAQTTGTNPVLAKTQTGIATPSSTSSGVVEVDRAKSNGKELDATGPNSNAQTEDASSEDDCMSADVPNQGSNQSLGVPLSQASGQVRTNAKNLAAIPQETGTPSAATECEEDSEDADHTEDEDDQEKVEATPTQHQANLPGETGIGGDQAALEQGTGRHANASVTPSEGKEQSQDVTSADNSQHVVTVTVTVFVAAPTASSAGRENQAQAKDKSTSGTEQGGDENQEEEEPASTAVETGVKATDSSSNNSKDVSTFMSDLPAQSDCNGKTPPSARSVEPRRLEYRGDLRRVRVATRYGSRRHDWWLQ